jgi:hypothetical protein
MSRRITLKRRISHRDVEVDLIDDIDDDDKHEVVAFNRRSWIWNYLPKRLQPEDLEWEWERTISRIIFSPAERWIIRQVDGATGPRVLGFIVLTMIESVLHPGSELMYVKLIAIHPRCRTWDFGLFRFSGAIKGVTRALLTLASERAKSVTGSAAIGLHAVGRSEALYKRLGMQRVPAGDLDGKPYYEGPLVF